MDRRLCKVYLHLLRPAQMFFIQFEQSWYSEKPKAYTGLESVEARGNFVPTMPRTATKGAAPPSVSK